MRRILACLSVVVMCMLMFVPAASATNPPAFGNANVMKIADHTRYNGPFWNAVKQYRLENQKYNGKGIAVEVTSASKADVVVRDVPSAPDGGHYCAKYNPSTKPAYINLNLKCLTLHIGDPARDNILLHEIGHAFGWPHVECWRKGTSVLKKGCHEGTRTTLGTYDDRKYYHDFVAN